MRVLSKKDVWKPLIVIGLSLSCVAAGLWTINVYFTLPAKDWKGKLAAIFLVWLLLQFGMFLDYLLKKMFEELPRKRKKPFVIEVDADRNSPEYKYKQRLKHLRELKERISKIPR